MGRCRKNEQAKRNRVARSLAKALAPEEIRSGDFVAALYYVAEWPSWFWDNCDPNFPRDETVRVCVTPACDPLPWEVRDVCLPFVLVRGPDGLDATLDIRRCRLARLDERFGRRARRALRKSSRKRASRGDSIR